MTKANCAARMNYFSSLLLTLLVFKSIVFTVLVLAWIIPTARKQLRRFKKWRSVPASRRTANVRRRKRRGSIVDVLKFQVDWVKMFRIISMVLFIGYPSVSIKILRLYNCVKVDSAYWLVADMRLQCYTPEWTGYAPCFLVGFPFLVGAALRQRGSARGFCGERPRLLPICGRLLCTAMPFMGL